MVLPRRPSRQLGTLLLACHVSFDAQLAPTPECVNVAGPEGRVILLLSSLRASKVNELFSFLIKEELSTPIDEPPITYLAGTMQKDCQMDLGG
jgi:hypothetical protein